MCIVETVNSGKCGNQMNIYEWASTFLEKELKQIETDAELMRDQKMPAVTDELYCIYGRTGSRVEFEAVYFKRRHFLAVFGMMAVMYGRQEDIEKLEEVIEQICRERCWALPAHVDPGQAGWETTVELYASETAQALTELSELLKEKLSEQIRSTIRRNVDQRVLIPFFQSVKPYAWWETSQMNWNAVCLGSIGCIALYRYEEDPAYWKKCLERVHVSIQNYIRGYKEDGVCMEGLDYWTYGMEYYCMYAELLWQRTGVEFFRTTDHIKEILEFQQKCYLGNGLTLSFSDGSSKSRFRMGLTLYLASVDSEVRIPEGEPLYFNDDGCYHWAELYRDVAWTKKYIEKIGHMNKKDMEDVEGMADLPGDQTECMTVNTQECNDMIYEFAQSQWAVGIGKHGSVAVKGGCNDEPHNHNDVGNFIVVRDGVEYIADLGAGEYTRDYFHENRYRIFCNSAESHNIPIINGKLQQQGKEYCCTAFVVDHNKREVSMELGKAYEKGCIEGLQRTIGCDLSRAYVSVCDQFQLSETTKKIEENLITKCACEIQGDQVILSSDEENLSQSILTIEQPVSDLRIIQKQHRNHEGELEEIHIIRWTVLYERGQKMAYGRFYIGDGGCL